MPFHSALFGGFRYFMKGKGLGSLLVYEVDDGKALWKRNLKYNVSGNQGETWLKAQMTLFGTNNTVQVS